VKDWYDNIEEPVRELVRRLRNEGINTTSSCGHEMYVQADIFPDAALQIIHNTVFNWASETNEAPEYTIEISLTVTRGVLMQCFATIRLLAKPLACGESKG